MKNNKGFTLIELLAVITILSIIMVIAVPNVLKTIDDTKKKARYMAAKDIVEIAAAYMEAENNCAQKPSIPTLTSTNSIDPSNIVDCKDSEGKLIDKRLVRVQDLCKLGFIENDSKNPADKDANNISSCEEFENQYVRYRKTYNNVDEVYNEQHDSNTYDDGIVKCGVPSGNYCYYYKFNGYVYGISGYE